MTSITMQSYSLYSQYTVLSAFIPVCVCDSCVIHPVGSSDGIAWTSGRSKKSPNLYVEIRVGENSAVQSTKVIERKRAPAWNEEFIMYV